jgi:hypothetical protein
MKPNLTALAGLALLALGFLTAWALRAALRRGGSRSVAAGSRPSGPLAFPTELVLGPAQRPALRIRRCEEGEPWRREPAAVPAAVRAALEPLLQQVPRMLFGGVAAASSFHHVILQFEPETAKALASRSLELMSSHDSAGAFRAIARDTRTNQIVEHGKFRFEVNRTAIAVALWQLAAIVTAQKYLVDINMGLKRIENGIERVHRFLVDKELGHLEGHLSYLRGRAKWLAGSQVTADEVAIVAHQLEHVESELGGTGRHMLRQMEHLLVSGAGSDWSGGWFNVTAAANEASELFDQLRSASEGLLLAVQARVLGALLRAAMGMSHDFLSSTLADVENQLDEHRTLWVRIRATVDAKLPQMKAPLQFTESDRRAQSSLAAALSSYQDQSEAAGREMNGEVARFREQLRAASAEPLMLALEVDVRGQLGRAERLVPL